MDVLFTLTSLFFLHRYGLAGAILSKDRDRCSRVVKVYLNLAFMI